MQLKYEILETLACSNLLTVPQIREKAKINSNFKPVLALLKRQDLIDALGKPSSYQYFITPSGMKALITYKAKVEKQFAHHIKQLMTLGEQL